MTGAQVYRGSGPKWRLAWGFTLLPEWQDYKRQYKGGDHLNCLRAPACFIMLEALAP